VLWACEFTKPRRLCRYKSVHALLLQLVGPLHINTDHKGFAGGTQTVSLAWYNKSLPLLQLTNWRQDPVGQTSCSAARGQAQTTRTRMIWEDKRSKTRRARKSKKIRGKMKGNKENTLKLKIKTKVHGLNTRANYTDRTTATCRRS
jgi:hypothetical protein